MTPTLAFLLYLFTVNACDIRLLENARYGTDDEYGGFMDDNKSKHSVWLTEDAFKIVEAFYKLDDCPNRSVFIDRAIRFYGGYVAQNKTTNFLAPAITESMERVVGSFENRMAKILFKYSVEQALLMNVIAAYHKVDPVKIERIRGQCIDQVKRTRGNFNFSDAMKWQHGDEDE